MAEQKQRTIQGNEVNGYMVVQMQDGKWVQISQRFSTYDTACSCLVNYEKNVVESEPYHQKEN